MIKNLLIAAALFATLGGVAQADSVFDFTYTFSDGLVLTGSLDGTQSGQFVTNISNVSITFAGNTFSGTMLGGSFDGTALPNGAFDFTKTPVVSFNGTLNNFIFSDATDLNSASNYFFFVNGATQNAPGTFVANANAITNSADFDIPGAGTWSLTPVPLPAALPLLVSGLGFLGLNRRRRLKADAAQA